MTYFSLSDYNDYYVIPFVDIDGNEWKITIQSPNGDTPMDPIQLVGAANPIEWMGVGDEDQTNVVLGSTGTLRLVCTDATKNEFVQGALFPEAINERKVIVTRKTNNTDVLIWQGFIKPEQYTQDWDRPPYEIELPIVSPIAASEYFTMPDYNSVVEKSTIADLLWYVFYLLGCDIHNLITNKPVYEDFNGNTQTDENDRPLHWTQGVASCYFFYDFEGDGIKPKTLKEVLETICYPYGKVNDCRDYVTVMMAAGKWISGENYLYELDMTHTSINYHRFVLLNGNQSSIEFDIEDLQIASTDNSATLISKPSSVSFDNTINVDSEIYETSGKYLKSTLPCSTTILQDSTKVYLKHLSGLDKYTYRFSGEYVDSAMYAAVYQYGFTEGTNDPMFCRAVTVSTDDDGVTYKYNLQVPLGFYMRPTGNSSYYAFDIPNKIRSIAGKNKVKVSFDVYCVEDNSKSPTGQHYMDVFCPIIIDATENKYLDLQDRQWKTLGNSYTNWTWKGISYLTDCTVTFNEPRASSDKSLHTLRFAFHTRSTTGSAAQYAFYVTMRVEYVKDDSYTSQLVVDTFLDDLINAGQKLSNGGSGADIDIDFKTMCGRTSIIINGNGFIPYNSFCDSQNYIDTGNRKKIELSAVKFTSDFIARPFLVNDGSTVYFPVAFGMNPRDNTVRLTLVSTNIGITQPTQS